MQAYLLIIIFFAAGVGVNRFFTVRPDYAEHKRQLIKRLNIWIIQVALPALIFLYVPSLVFSSLAIIPTLVAWVWIIISAILVLLLGRLLSLRRDIIGAMLLLVALGNTSFLGYPMILALLNKEVLAYAIFLDQFGSFIALSTFGTFVIAIYSSPTDAQLNKQELFRIILIKIITFAPLLAMLVALFLPIETISLKLQPLLSLLGSSLMPASLFVIGLQFQARLLSEHLPPLGIAIVLKMAMAPLLVWLVLDAADVPAVVLQASVFEMAMPAMMTPGILAMQANIAPRFCASLLGYSTLLSLISLPLVAFLLS